ncbi:hypothetical protein HDU67_003746, partial [Dinochytrium kinnereticum]
IESTLHDHKKTSFKHLTGALVVVCFTVTVNLTKSILIVIQNSLKGRSSSKTPELRRISMFLLPIAFSLNLVSATVEGVATYILLKQILERIGVLADVEIVLFHSAYSILISDATLTGSASRFELAQGDVFWSNRYNDYLPPLDAAIATAKRLAQTPGDQTNFRIIDSVNAILVDLETITLNNYTDGLAAMYGNDYLYNKNVYNYAALQFVQAQSARINSNLQTQKLSIDYLTYLSIALTASGLVLSIMTVAWKGSKGDNYLKPVSSMSSLALDSVEKSDSLSMKDGKACSGLPKPVRGEVAIKRPMIHSRSFSVSSASSMNA